MGLFDLFSPAKQKLKLYNTILPKILGLKPKFEGLQEEELKAYGQALRARATAGAEATELLPEAFALVREVAKRTIGLEPFPVQLLGGIALYFGNIAEMQTGEGKTLAATCPFFLNAIMGHKGHLVTVNDYLAKRDKEWMEPIYNFLGLSVGLLQNDSIPVARKVAYASDIVYGTNNEFGFDYLRDNMVGDQANVVQKGTLDYAMVDEVDNIFIDEARTALIIAGPSETKDTPYYETAAFAKKLKGISRTELPPEEKGVPEGIDYVYDEKMKTIEQRDDLLARFADRVRIPKIRLLDDQGQATYDKLLRNAIKAQVFFKKDEEYIVKDATEVIIVDEFTGRLMYGRRYSDGLHQAIEAKEKLTIREENQTLATITIQNFFKMYKKLAGMTGTAQTEADELKEIYNLDVIPIETNKKNRRKDNDDEIYSTEQGKISAILEEIKGCYEKGQPILVGTRSVEKSETLSKELRKFRIKHEVLNAKYYEKEAKIIAEAGRKGTVTIATNMAGRGVDILLGGNPESLALAEYSGKEPEKYKKSEEYKNNLAKYKELCGKEHEAVVALGGLFILGTERHESRRIDNQLRGRSGRQGDPGETKFFLSAEDDILRIFGGDSIQNIFKMLKVEEAVPVNHPLLTRTIKNSQKKLESYNFDARKSLLEYDDVLNVQRDVIYGEREKVLAGEDLSEEILAFIKERAGAVAQKILGEVKTEESKKDLVQIYKDFVSEEFGRYLALPEEELEQAVETIASEEVLATAITNLAEGFYQSKREHYGTKVMPQIEQHFFLEAIDTAWKDQLLQLEDLKDGIGLRAMGNQDPIIAYKKETYEMFNLMEEQIKKDIVRNLFMFELQAQPQLNKKYDRT